MPAVHLLERKLAGAGLLPGELHPIVRVRLRLLDRIGKLSTPIRLPEHLADDFGGEGTTAREFSESYPALSRRAAERLDTFRDPAARERWQKEHFAERFARLAELDARRRELARIDPKSPEIREVSRQVKAVRVDILDATLRRIYRDWQLRHVDYWDSRGALLPWCIALGGERLYNEVIAQAEICRETPQ